MVITAFDDFDNPIGSPVMLTPGNPFELASFSGSIDHLNLVNNDSLMSSVDDFGFTAVPEPATFAMVSLGLILGLSARRRTRLRSAQAA